MARVFGGDQISACQHGECPQGNVAEIADRRRHKIKPRLKRPGDQFIQHLTRAYRQ